MPRSSIHDFVMNSSFVFNCQRAITKRVMGNLVCLNNLKKNIVYTLITSYSKTLFYNCVIPSHAYKPDEFKHLANINAFCLGFSGSKKLELISFRFANDVMRCFTDFLAKSVSSCCPQQVLTYSKIPIKVTVTCNKGNVMFQSIKIEPYLDVKFENLTPNTSIFSAHFLARFIRLFYYLH